MDPNEAPKSGRADDVRMTIWVRLETGDGERICEIKDEHVLLALLSPAALPQAVPDFETSFYALVVAPLRGMLRGKILQLKETSGYTRMFRFGSTSPKGTVFDRVEDECAFMETVRLMWEQRTDGDNAGEDHDASASFDGLQRQ